MTDEPNWLLITRLRAVAEAVRTAADATAAGAAWRSADVAVAAGGAADDADVALPVMERSLPDLDALLDAWTTRRKPLSAWDQAVLKRAMKAFHRRLDLTRGDDEVSSSRNPLTRGEASSISGVRPPEKYPADIWSLLVAQGRLAEAGDGVLEPTGR